MADLSEAVSAILRRGGEPPNTLSINPYDGNQLADLGRVAGPLGDWCVNVLGCCLVVSPDLSHPRGIMTVTHEDPDA
jgi:hypothetical protein